MTGVTLVDAGPLVAFLDADEFAHEWALQAFDASPAPLLTCEAVLVEACFLVRKRMKTADGVMELLKRGVIRLEFNLASEHSRVQEMMRRYGDLPMSLADACLVRMAELIPASRMMTMDRDFTVYRRHGRQTIPLLAPFA